MAVELTAAGRVAELETEGAALVLPGDHGLGAVPLEKRVEQDRQVADRRPGGAVEEGDAVRRLRLQQDQHVPQMARRSGEHIAKLKE